MDGCSRVGFHEPPRLERGDPPIAEAALGLEKGEYLARFVVDDRSAEDRRVGRVVERPARPEEHVVVERGERSRFIASVEHEFSQQSEIGGSRADAEQRVLDACHDREEAVAVAASGQRLELPQGRRGSPRLKGLEGGAEPAGMKMSQLIARYESSTAYKSKAPNTRRGYASGLKVIRDYFVDQHGDQRVDRIKRAHVMAFLDWRSRTPLRKRAAVLDASTVAKDRVMLHILFAFAEELEVVASNPVRRVKPPKSDGREPAILSDDQLGSLEACEERPMLRTYIMVLAEAGLRCESEALWLRWADVDLEGGFLTVEGVRKGTRTKSGKSRVVPLTPRLRAALRDHAATFRLAMY